ESVIVVGSRRERYGHMAKKNDGAGKTESASRRIDARIEDLGDWRGETLSRIRSLIKEADPAVVEEWKWQKATSPGVRGWSHDGGICTGEAYKSVVKLTFFKGAQLKDPLKLFNSSLEGNVRRAIDLREGEKLNEPAFKALIRNAVALNTSSDRARPATPDIGRGRHRRLFQTARNSRTSRTRH